jgi:hypothetical protein
MSCCHADFAAVEGSDRGFTVGMPTFTFGRGVLVEAGRACARARLKRVALFTDSRLASSEYVATVKASLEAAGVDAAIYSGVSVEPTDASFQEADALCGRRQIRRLRVRRRRLGHGHLQGGESVRAHPAEFMTYVNAPIGAGRRSRPGQAAHRLPTTSGTGRKRPASRSSRSHRSTRRPASFRATSFPTSR